MAFVGSGEVAMANNSDPFLHDVRCSWQLCRFCTHLHNLVGDLRCAAFPSGIPREITSGQLTHDKPLLEQENDLIFHAC